MRVALNMKMALKALLRNAQSIVLFCLKINNAFLR